MKPPHLRRLILTTALLLGSILPATAADFTSTWDNTIGNWTDTSKWSTPGAPGTFPNNGSPTPTYDAIQTGGNLTVNQAITIEKYTLGGGPAGATNTGAGFDLTLNGLLTFTGSGFSGTQFNGTGTINANGGSLLSGGGMIVNGRVLNLSGTTSWTSGTINVQNSGSLVNTASGVMTNTLSGFNVIEGNGSFTNAGTFTDSGSGHTRISAPFTNTGTVNANSGMLEFFGVSTHSGALVVGSGAVLSFGGGALHQLNTGTSFSGNGTVSLDSATLLLNSAVSTSSTTPFNISASGTISGGGALTLNGHLTWSGTIGGTGVVNVNSTATISAGGNTLSGRVMNLNGNTTWSSNPINLANSASLVNTATGTLTSTLSGYNPIEGSGTFTNAGTFTQASGNGYTGIRVPFSNTGTVNVNNGTVDLMDYTAIQHSGSTLTGGTWNVANGSVLTFTQGSNITTLGSAATVKLSGAGSSFTKLTAALNNNQGSFTLANNRDLTTAGAYANSGTTRVEDSTTVMTIGTGGSAAYTQTGPSSVTILSGGAMIDSSAFNLNGGALRGTGTIDGPLTATSGNATTIAPGASPGTITINGSTVLGVNNTLTMEVGGLAAGIDYDVLDVNGVLTLGGLLDIDFINGFENTIQFYDFFTIATADSPILGSFSNVLSGSSVGTNTAFNFNVWYGAGSPFGANNLVITQAPEPSRTLLLALGAASLMLRRRRKS